MNTLNELSDFKINTEFADFINKEVLPQTDIDETVFWQGFVALLKEFMPENARLCQFRDELQATINRWHQDHSDRDFDLEVYHSFLEEIGYLVPEGEDFSIETENVDAEISQIAGPQLVVPLKNARFALNAANARWGSLYDALYGSDVIPQTEELKMGEKYNSERGQRVISIAKDFLDEHFPLAWGSHHEVTEYLIYFDHLFAVLADGSQSGLAHQSQFVGFNGSKNHPDSIFLQHNKLHIELLICRHGLIGATDPAGIDDILVESALTTIMDCEDSVAAVDCEDKLEVYRNWLGLIQGSLETTFHKDGKIIHRKMNGDRLYTDKDGQQQRLSGRSLLLIRNVGMHMNSTMITHKKLSVPEGIIDAVVTTLIGSLDLVSDRRFRNSHCGSIYIVKPKLHGPAEVAFTCQLFDRIEDLLQLSRHTVKLGIMDEERRTSINLKECIRQAKHRVVFINTGFLDRTGDEIHTSFFAGPFLPKAQIKQQPWFTAYENNNVEIGLRCGFSGRAQIGKGMWPMPDAMAQMLSEKIIHPQSLATTAWVPSPTAATLHALHYHQVDVFGLHRQWQPEKTDNLKNLLTIPLLKDVDRLTKDAIQQELSNNIQAILGYVVHWINDGIGCSKIPDINNIGLMEDRATLRINSQHIANWLHHGICQKDMVDQLLETMAQVVDNQNRQKTTYRLLKSQGSFAFDAAKALIYQGAEQPNGYTEWLLHTFRNQEKQLTNTMFNSQKTATLESC